MRRVSVAVLIGCIALAAGVLPASAQTRISPHETVSRVVDGNRVMVVYGRPYSKDPKTGELRHIWGSLVPFDRVWRMGADEATLLLTQKPILLGKAQIPAGVYSLWLLLNKDNRASLIVNKQVGQWGLQYDEKQDFVRIDLKKESTSDRVDQFTIAVEKNPEGPGGTLLLGWENTRYTVPFTVVK